MKSTLTFLYVEDEERFAKFFKDKVEKYLKQKHIRVFWKTYQRIERIMDFQSVDACFFDYQIENKNITDVCDLRNIQVPVIIVSQYENCIHECVHFHIFDFVRKTLLQDIYQTLDNLLNYYEKQDFVFHKINQTLYRIKIEDILYMRLQAHYMMIYFCDGDKLEIWKGYNEVFQENYPSLLRTHRSYVVNIRQCLKIDEQGVHMKNHQIIPISKRNLKKIQKEYYRYFI